MSKRFTISAFAGYRTGRCWRALWQASDGIRSPRVFPGWAGFGLGFILYLPLYLIRGLRAGDVKLLAAVGAIAGPVNCMWILILTTVLGGAIVLVFVVIRKRTSQTFFNVSWIVRDLLLFKAPY